MVQDMGFDYSDAEDHFGELNFILEKKEASVFNMQRVTALVKKRLWDADFSDNDYILAVGSPALLMLVGMIAGDIVRNGFNVLQWDRKEQKYFSVNIRRK